VLVSIFAASSPTATFLYLVNIALVSAFNVKYTVLQ